MPTKLFPAQFESLDDIREFAANIARSKALEEKDVYNIQLAVDEAATNIIEHAYEGIPNGEIELSVIASQKAIKIIMTDHGRRFNPDEIAEPDIKGKLEDRATGGLGLFFMHKLMDVVNFEWDPSLGNKVTMIKKFPEKSGKIKKKAGSGYDEIFKMGGKILSARTFAAQQDIIVETISAFVDGPVSLWLNEAAFRLPDWVESLYKEEPDSSFQKIAHFTGNTVSRSRKGVNYLCIPIRQDELGMGVIEIRRHYQQQFSQKDLRFLEGVAATASIALIAWHRINVERWRLGQLALVRTVSAQIANESDIDLLANKVTRLIQATFKYYYVGIFSLEPGKKELTFRSGTGGATRRKGFLGELSFETKIGEGLVGLAVQSGEEVLANDVSAEPNYKPVDTLPETSSELAIPLKIEDRIVGILDLQSDLLNAFHPYDLLVLRALADSVAMALDGARMYGDLNKQADQMRAVGDVSKQITSILNLHQLMQEVATLISVRFNFPYVHLFTVHPTRRQIHYEAGSGVKSEALEGYVLNLDDAEGIIPWVARNGETVLTNDVDTEPRYVPSPLPPSNTRSELTVPLVFNNQVNGILDIQSDHENAFTNSDKLIIETMADSIASAVRNADLYQSEQWRRQAVESLREVAVLLSANASLEQVLEAILTELERNLPSDISAIWLLDEENIFCAAVHGANATELEQARINHPEATGMLAAALLSRQSLIRRPSDPMGPSAISAGFNSEHSSIAVPLRIGDQSVGVLTLAHHTSGRYGHEAQNMTTTFASYAAVAIENARLYDASQEQAYASAALLQVAQAVVSLSNIDEILETIVRTIPILVGVEKAAVYSWDTTFQKIIPAQQYGIPIDLLDLLWRPFNPGEFPLLDAVILQGQIAMSPDAHLGPENWLSIIPSSLDLIESITQSDERLLIAIPVILKGEIFGILLVEEALGGRRFRNRRLEILNGMAQQIALAVQNDIFQKEKASRSRLETEVQLARQIQETFIPKSLQVPKGWDLSARWRTALQMGGDFYDVINLPDGRLGLFIADVADKGIPAALFMALTRTLVRAAVIKTNSPAIALKQVNDLLYPDCEQGMFVTAVYGALDPLTGLFTYANAGHNPPIWLHKGELNLLSRTGIALGVVEFAQMDERSIHLEKDDKLVLYTDGVTEAYSAAGKTFGEERLKDLIANDDSNKAEPLMNKIDDDVTEFYDGDPLTDDVTLLVLVRQE